MKNPFKKSFTAHEMVMFNFLRALRVFRNLTNEELSDFLPSLHERTYTKDEVIFFREDPSHAFYIIWEGTVLLNIEVEGQFEELRTVGIGSGFGESSFIPNCKRITNAIVSSEEARMYVIPQVSLFSIFEDDPKIKSKVLESLSSQYYDLYTHVIKSYKSSRGFFHIGAIYND